MMLDRARLGLEILAESEQDLAVIKPAGMASELTRDPRNESLLARFRLAAAPGVAPKLVHRLDRVTRGIMIVALSREAAAFHGEQIREGRWKKYYLARIPTPAPGSQAAERLIGKHKAYIAEEPDRARLVRSGGKPSFLEVLAVGAAPGRRGESHVLIQLLTGRLHQIRVMLAGLGLPLVGDALYGGGMSEGAPMYLEHCVLRHPDLTTGKERLLFRREDAEREELHPAVLSALDNVVGG